MSLQTDIIFVKALRADENLMAQLPAGDVYNTTIALPDEDLDNAPLPLPGLLSPTFPALSSCRTSAAFFR